uniref:Uncharacterized protein n=1 Tax=Chenopodium quinoa TaxID=63459 RepID=A0A803MG65_CHEQI
MKLNSWLAAVVGRGGMGAVGVESRLVGSYVGVSAWWWGLAAVVGKGRVGYGGDDGTKWFSGGGDGERGWSSGKGLRRVYDDDEVRKMTAIALKNRNLYVVHGVSDPEVLPVDASVLERALHEQVHETKKKPEKLSKGGQRRKKLTPKRGPLKTKDAITQPVRVSRRRKKDESHKKDAPTSTSKPYVQSITKTVAREKGKTSGQSEVPLEYEWEDSRPDSPLPYNQLFEVHSEEDSDSLYEPGSENIDGDLGYDIDTDLDIEDDVDLGDDEFQFEDELQGLDEEDIDEECRTAAKRVRGYHNKLTEIVHQLQKEAAKRKLKAPIEQEQRQHLGEQLVPKGVGVLISSDGSTMTTIAGRIGGQRVFTDCMSSQLSQASTLHKQTQ